MQRTIPRCCLGLLGLMFCSSTAWSADWPQWGGSDNRNLVSDETGLPDSFVPGKRMPSGGGIDPKTTENVKWTARLGSAAYGNPTVAGGKVFVGTDDLMLADDPRFQRTRGGLVKCLDEATGKLLWQLVTPKRTRLPEGAHFSHQHLGGCSSPTIDGNRMYVVGSAGDVLCVDVNGQADGNDGPFQEEARYMAGEDNPPVELTADDADIVWRFDPIDELAVIPHDAASCSALIHGELVYVGTSNGVDEPHAKVLSPLAPSLIVLDKRTGRLVATDDEKIGTRLYHAQWSSPSLGQVGEETLVFFGGGDGVCYAFEALSGPQPQPVHLKRVWSYDCNPPEYKLRDGKPIPYYEGDKRKGYSTNKNDGRYVGPSQIIATPVYCAGRVYVAIGQDPAHGRGKGMLHCIDPSGSGDITETGRVWTYGELDRSISTVSVADGLLYIPDIAGRLHCLDADTGERRWVYDTEAETWGGPLLVDGKIFLANKNAFFTMVAGSQPRLLSRTRLGSPAYSTPIAANGVLYVSSQRYLWAVRQDPQVAQRP
ncbi:MAG: PQQ-binding-like beta-propeller repeat protein [Pirellulales bacterium]|nr:PQQ-binding-like beta-propeller repeat protein [Pirellulales bacterium]